MGHGRGGSGVLAAVYGLSWRRKRYFDSSHLPLYGPRSSYGSSAGKSSMTIRQIFYLKLIRQKLKL